MTLTIKGLEPSVITVHYDIKSGRKRDELRRELKREGLSMQTESVYGGLYTENAFLAVKKFEREDKNSEVYILTSGLPSDQLIGQIDRFERNFASEFDKVEENLEEIEDMLSNDLLYVEDREIRGQIMGMRNKGLNEKANKLMFDNGKPYNFAQIMGRVHNVGYMVDDLEKGLAKRKEREQARWKNITAKALNRYALRLRMMKKYNDALYSATGKRQKNEDKKIKVQRPTKNDVEGSQ